MSPKPFFANQPKRCADGETGLAGACLACGAAQQHLCQAPVAERPRLSRRRAKA